MMGGIGETSIGEALKKANSKVRTPQVKVKRLIVKKQFLLLMYK